MQTRQRIPEDLVSRTPGPELAAVLAALDPARLTGDDAVTLLQARYRQLAHEQARYLELMAEVGRCAEPDGLQRCEPDEFAATEARAALVLTRRRAEEEFAFADGLLGRLPAVHAAMRAGDCDRPRAWIFLEWTADLTVEQARALADRLLPQVAAGELTTGQLIERIKKLAIALDPEWARRRYEEAVAGRKVLGTRNPDGTANLGGYNLPVDRVVAAADHIDALAKAAKRAGSRRRLDHLRAELFLGMTDGAYTSLTDGDIVALLLATTDGDEPADREPADRAGPNTSSSDEAGRCRGGMELRARIGTLLGRDRYPAELAGWGPVHADLARDLVARLVRGEWRWVVTEPDGHLVNCGYVRTRPTGSSRGGLHTRDVVELQIPETMLDDPGELGAWAPVVADIAGQHAATRDDTGRFAADAHRRHPGAAQRRWLQVRDRLLGLGCRAPARGNQQDHTVDHGLGGLTLDWNLGGLCGHDHRVKTEAGWSLTRTERGHFRWRSRLGHEYDVPPRRVTEPLPDPRPGDPDPYPCRLPPEGDWERDAILPDPPAEPEPPPAVARSDPDEDPPF